MTKQLTVKEYVIVDISGGNEFGFLRPDYKIAGKVSEIPEKKLPEDIWQHIAKFMSENNLTPPETLILKKVFNGG